MAAVDIWEERFDEKTNHVYYYNPATNESVWEHPGHAAERASAAAARASRGVDASAEDSAAAGGGAGAACAAAADGGDGTRSAAAAAAVLEDGKPDDWITRFDPISRHKYYYSPSRKTSQWTRPKSGALARKARTALRLAAAAKAASAAQEDAWVQMSDARGRAYYWNTTTDETTWTPPEAIAAKLSAAAAAAGASPASPQPAAHARVKAEASPAEAPPSPSLSRIDSRRFVFAGDGAGDDAGDDGKADDKAAGAHSPAPSPLRAASSRRLGGTREDAPGGVVTLVRSLRPDTEAGMSPGAVPPHDPHPRHFGDEGGDAPPEDAPPPLEASRAVEVHHTRHDEEEEGDDGEAEAGGGEALLRVDGPADAAPEGPGPSLAGWLHKQARNGKFQLRYVVLENRRLRYYHTLSQYTRGKKPSKGLILDVTRYTIDAAGEEDEGDEAEAERLGADVPAVFRLHPLHPADEPAGYGPGHVFVLRAASRPLRALWVQYLSQAAYGARAGDKVLAPAHVDRRGSVELDNPLSAALARAGGEAKAAAADDGGDGAAQSAAMRRLEQLAAEPRKEAEAEEKGGAPGEGKGDEGDEGDGGDGKAGGGGGGGAGLPAHVRHVDERPGRLAVSFASAPFGFTIKAAWGGAAALVKLAKPDTALADSPVRPGWQVVAVAGRELGDDDDYDRTLAAIKQAGARVRETGEPVEIEFAPIFQALS